MVKWLALTLLISAVFATTQAQGSPIRLSDCVQRGATMIVEGKEVICDGEHWLYFPHRNTPTPAPTTTPTPRPTPTPRWTMPEDELPRIEGDRSFVDEIRDGLNWLWENQRRIFQLVIDHIDLITPTSGDGLGSRAHVQRAHVEIGWPLIKHDVFVASVLLHEACHMLQYKKNPGMPWASDWQMIQFEKECYEGQLVFIEHIGWGDSWIARMLSGILSQSYEEWLEYVRQNTTKLTR